MGYLTLEETMKELNRSRCTLTTHFKRTQDNLIKKGIYLERYGTGTAAKYTIEYRKE